MAFTKQKKSKEQPKDDTCEEEPRTQSKKFEATTNDELKQIAKRARKSERKRADAKAAKKEIATGDRVPRLKGDALRDALVARSKFKVYANNFFNKFIEIVKENNGQKPRYRSYMKSDAAQGQFMFEIATCLSRMSWPQLTELLHSAVTSTDHPVGLATKSWSEVSAFVNHCMHLALGVVEKKGRLRLSDPSVLDDWPVEERKRKSKEDEYMRFNEEDQDRKNTAMQAAGRKDDDEEDDDEDDEEDSDDEYEESDDEESDEDSDDDDADDDEDDEKSSKRSSKSAKKKRGFGKSTSKSKDDSDDDEESDDDEDDSDDEDEDDKPKKSKRKEKEVSSKKAKKAAKPDKSEKKSAKKTVKKERAERPAKLEVKDSTVLFKGDPREKGGPKKKLLELIPKKGIALKALQSAAKEAGLPVAKVKAWVIYLHGYGYIKTK